MMADPPELTEHERCNLLITALHQAAAAGQATTLARIHYSWLASAADKIEQLTKKLAEAEAALKNTLLHYKISDVHFVDSDDLAR